MSYLDHKLTILKKTILNSDMKITLNGLSEQFFNMYIP